jgi:tol-pal system protein YbgF
MFLKIFIFIISIFWLNCFFQACSASRNESDDGLSTEERRQKEELDEIESLLGITSEEKSEFKKQPAETGTKNQETLGLLDSDRALIQTQSPVAADMKTPQPGQTTISDKEKKQMENEIKDLKSQISEKDMMIADLRAQLSFQSEQLKEKAPVYSSSYPSSSYSYNVSSDVSMDYQEKYEQALGLFHARDYRGAIEIFESLLATSAENSLSDNAQYWIGESHYALGQYDKAIIDFEKVFTFTKSNKNDDAQYKLGLCYFKKGEATKAKEEFQRLLDLFPKSEYVSRAKEKLNSL